MNAALRGWLDKFVGAGVNRVVVCLDGVFNVQKAEEAHMRTRDRYADSLNLEKRLVRYPDPTFIRTKLSGNEGFLPRLVRTCARVCIHAVMESAELPRSSKLPSNEQVPCDVSRGGGTFFGQTSDLHAPTPPPASLSVCPLNGYAAGRPTIGAHISQLHPPDGSLGSASNGVCRCAGNPPF